MAYGDQYGGSTSSCGDSIADSIARGDAESAGILGRDFTNRLLGDGGSAQTRLVKAIQPDADLARPVIDRRMRYVEEHYPTWSGEISRAALGVGLMSLTKDITAQDLVQFSHESDNDGYT